MNFQNFGLANTKRNLIDRWVRAHEQYRFRTDQGYILIERWKATMALPAAVFHEDFGLQLQLPMAAALTRAAFRRSLIA
jgi:hypothetical protein